MSESVQARDALQKLGRPIDFIVYDDEGHGFRKTENRVSALKRRADFLEKHLANRWHALSGTRIWPSES